MDVGANIGMFTDRSLSDGASKVISFEPPKDRFPMFNRKIVMIVVNYIKMGLSDHEGSENY